MSHHCFSGRAKEDPAQSGAAVRSDYYEINFALFCYPNDRSRSLGVNYQLFDIEPGAFIAFSQLCQLALSRVFQLLADVRNWQRLGHSGVAYRRNDRFDNVDADDARTECPCQRCRVRERKIPALAEIRRQ